MKILFVTRPITENLDEGSKKNVWQIASNIKDNHFYLTIDHRHNPITVKNKTNINFVKIFSNQKLNIFQKIKLLAFLIFENRSIDIYHFFFVPTLLSSKLFFYITKLKNKKSIQSVPALHKDNLNIKSINNILFGDVIVVYSAYTAQKLKKIGFRNVRQIKPGIDLTRYYNRSDKKSIRSYYDLPVNKIIVLFSGELSRLNSLNLLLSIINLVLPTTEEVLFVISCPTRLAKDVKSLNRIEKIIFDNNLEKRVILLKQVKDFSTLLSACDIFLYPVSSMVGKIEIPLTLLEAMATELPIIVSDVEPLKEIFKLDAGIIVPFDDKTAFVQAILKLAKDASLRKRMGWLGRKIIENHYSLNSMIKDYEELYNEFT